MPPSRIGPTGHRRRRLDNMRRRGQSERSPESFPDTETGKVGTERFSYYHNLPYRPRTGMLTLTREEMSRRRKSQELRNPQEGESDEEQRKEGFSFHNLPYRPRRATLAPKLEKKIRRGSAQDTRGPSPDIETDEVMRAEHFAYYNLDYHHRTPTSVSKEMAVFKDPSKEGRRHSSQMTLPIRARLGNSRVTAVEIPISIFGSFPLTRRHSSATSPISLDTKVQMILADPLADPRKDSVPNDLNRQPPTRLNQMELFEHAQQNEQIQNLVSKIGESSPENSGGKELQVLTSNLAELNLKNSQNPTGIITPGANSSTSPAVSFRGIPSVDQLSATLAAGVKLEPGLNEIADSLFNKDTMPEVYIPRVNELEHFIRDCKDLAQKDRELIEQVRNVDKFAEGKAKVYISRVNEPGQFMNNCKDLASKDRELIEQVRNLDELDEEKRQEGDEDERVL